MTQEGRPRIKGFEVSPTQHERNSVNFELKHHINGYIGANGVAEAGTRFYPSLKGSERKLKKRQLQKWYEDSAEIAYQVALGSGHLCKKPRAGAGGVLPREAEGNIAFWIRDLRREGVPVSPLMLQMKARRARLATLAK
ncbi:hypothetical protein PC120_g11857 [Phytophthora cactorum]|nr:hypothetical protein PC120_g11857 [Phytophthora cactorum]